MESTKIAVIKIELADVDIPIWRRIETPFDITLHQLQNIIQETMGWKGSRQYYFKIAGANYDINDEDSFDMPDDIDSRETKLAAVWDKSEKCVYTYDFGDNWKHNVYFEQIISARNDANYPRCTGGTGACPPEDIGGASGYKEFIQTAKDPHSPLKQGYKEILGWSDEHFKNFNPEHFDLEEANQRLSELVRQNSPVKNTELYFADLQKKHKL